MAIKIKKTNKSKKSRTQRVRGTGADTADSGDMREDRNMANGEMSSAYSSDSSPGVPMKLSEQQLISKGTNHPSNTQQVGGGTDGLSVNEVPGAKIKGVKGIKKGKGGRIGKIARDAFISPSERGYPSIAEYLDTRGKFDPAYSKESENITGAVTSGRTISKVGDRNYAQTAYTSGGKAFRGGSWDRTGRVFTPSRVSYTPKRTGLGSRFSPYVYSMEELKSK